MKRGLILSCFLFVLTNLTFAQLSTGVLTVLSQSPSPQLSSYGSAGTSAPISDAYSFYYNPAHLGLNQPDSYFKAGFYPENSYLFNIHELNFNSTALSAGWQFNNKVLPLRLGIGYMRTSMGGLSAYLDDIGGIPNTNDHYSAFALGAGIDYYLSFNLGVTYKNIVSAFPEPIKYHGEPRIERMETSLSALDFGVLISAPFMKLMNHPLDFEYSKGLMAKPFLDLSLGYAVRNIGGEISFSSVRPDPIARTASIGYTISAGADFELQPGNILRIFEADFSTEAEDLLVKYSYDPETYVTSYSYKNIASDINIWKNVILGHWNEKILRHRGIRIELAEIFQYNWGSLKSYSYGNMETKGWGIRAKGLLKGLKRAGKTIGFIAEHFDIQYFYTSDGSFPYTDLSSFSLTVSGLENLF